MMSHSLWSRLGLLVFTILLAGLASTLIYFDVQKNTFSPLSVFAVLNLLTTTVFLIYLVFCPQVMTHPLYGTQESDVGSHPNPAFRSMSLTQTMSLKRRRDKALQAHQQVNHISLEDEKPGPSMSTMTGLDSNTRENTYRHHAGQLGSAFPPLNTKTPVKYRGNYEASPSRVTMESQVVHHSA